MEEVYVKQPPNFENEKISNHVYNLSKALNGLKQSHRAWYDRLKNFLLDNGFSMELKKRTLLSLLSIRTKIYLLFKFMLMILYLILLMSLCAMIY